MKFLLGFEKILVRAETFLLVLSLSVMVLLAFAQVVLRNLFSTGFVWGDTVVRHLVLWVGFAGAAVAASSERHIGIDALTKFLPPRIKHVGRIITNLFAAVVCFYLAEAAYTLFLDEMEYGGTFVLDIPSWVPMIVLSPGYLLMLFHFLIKAVQSALLAAGRTESGTSS